MGSQLDRSDLHVWIYINTCLQIKYHYTVTVSDSVQQEVISTENKSVISKKNISTNEPDESVKPVPLPRNCSTIKVCFTARPFPTPQRESQAQEEEEVLRLYKCSECILQSSIRTLYCSWFQTLSVFWMLYAFFWVIHQRL
jgi:hypothetical protein